MARARRAYFAHQESLRCQLLRQRAGQGSLSSDAASESSPEEPKDDAPQPVQPVQPVQPDPPKIEPPWQYPVSKWRNHPAVLNYDDEAFIFIRADSYPTDSDAAAPLMAWLRQPGKLSSPSKKPIYSAVIRVEDVGWIVTFGHTPGAMNRMIRLLERKAGQILISKGRKFSVAMDTHMPLEWMP